MTRPELRRASIRYAAAIASVGVVLILRIVLMPHTGPESPFLLFMGAVMFSAAFGGLGPGLLATALAAAASEFFLMRPAYALALTDDQALRVLLFVGEGVFVSVICSMLKTAQRRAVASAREARALEHEVVEISDREQRRIGHDLHDGLGQHLTGVAFVSRLVSRRLEGRAAPEADDARKVDAMVNQAISWTRDLAAGLAPVEGSAEGLPDALRELAENTQEIFKVPCACRVRLPDGAAPPTGSTATHLFRIAQEAVSNAIRHGKARHVWIELAAMTTRDAEDHGGNNGTGCMLVVRDDGRGIDADHGPAGAGMGLKTMRYRARIIGGAFDVRGGEAGGTVVTCVLPPAARAAATAADNDRGSAEARTVRIDAEHPADVAPSDSPATRASS